MPFRGTQPFSLRSMWLKLYTCFSLAKGRNQSDPLPIHVKYTAINPSSSCTYLGLTIDMRMNWHELVTQKKTSIKRLLFIVNKCCGLPWSLSREKLTAIYISLFLPQITIWLYNLGWRIENEMVY
jgi:hypothetical protein